MSLRVDSLPGPDQDSPLTQQQLETSNIANCVYWVTFYFPTNEGKGVKL